MPCFFCIAIIATVGGALTTAVADRIKAALDGVALGDVTVLSDSATVRVLALDVAAPAARDTGPTDRDGAEHDGVPATTPVPVEVSLYKQAGRARITVRTHDVTAQQAEAIQDLVAEAAGLEVTERSGRPLQARVQQAEQRRVAAAQAEAAGETVLRR